MKLGLDEYAHLDSPLHRWEPRSKLLGLSSLILAYTFVEDWRLLLPTVAITVVIYWLSQLPFSFWLQRIRYPGVFLLGIVLILPFASGETVWLHLGPIALYAEGVQGMILIASRFLAIVTLALVLFGTGSFLSTVEAMRSLGLSPILADMMLLFYRYLFEIGDRLKTMQMAMRLRGFQPQKLSPRNLTLLASLAGTLLIRSYEQSEQVYRAMLLRGYGRIRQNRDRQPIRLPDAIALSAVAIVAMSLIGLQWKL